MHMTSKNQVINPSQSKQKPSLHLSFNIPSVVREASQRMRYLPLCVCFTLVLESQAHCGEGSHDLCLRKCCPNHQAMYKGACVDHVPTQFTMDVYEEAYLKTGGDLDAFPFVRVKINLGSTGEFHFQTTKDVCYTRFKCWAVLGTNVAK